SQIRGLTCAVKGEEGGRVMLQDSVPVVLHGSGRGNSCRFQSVATLSGVSALYEMILHHLMVEGCPGPVKLLRGFAPIPVTREDGGEHPVSLVAGKVVSLPEPPAELLRQIHE